MYLLLTYPVPLYLLGRGTDTPKSRPMIDHDTISEGTRRFGDGEVKLTDLLATLHNFIFGNVWAGGMLCTGCGWD